MKYLKIKFILFFLVSLTFRGCTDLLDVEFSEKEMKIVNECSSAQLNNKTDIEKGLIGRWKFIAYSCSTCALNSEFDEPEIEFFEDFTAEAKADEVDIKFSWEIVEKGGGQDQGFSIELTPGWLNIHRINIICQNYMIRQGSDIIYIYEKQ